MILTSYALIAGHTDPCFCMAKGSIGIGGTTLVQMRYNSWSVGDRFIVW